MTRLAFGRRLLLTAAGGAVGVVVTLLLIAVDPSVSVDPEAAGIFIAAGVAVAALGAVVTRRLALTIVASILAGVAVPATYFAIIVAVCYSGACE